MTIGLLLQYAIYAAIIVISLLLLGLINRLTKLPSHSELRKRMADMRDELAAFLGDGTADGKSAYDFFRLIERCANKSNKLAYIVTLIAQKERDGNLDEIAVLMADIYTHVSPYRFKTKEKDIEVLETALEKTEKAIASLDLILERDKDLHAKRIHGATWKKD